VEKWFRVKEVAARYGVGRDTIKRRIEKGYLKALVMPEFSKERNRVYNVYLVAKSELQRFERENTR
jgi:transposase